MNGRKRVILGSSWRTQRAPGDRAGAGERSAQGFIAGAPGLPRRPRGLGQNTKFHVRDLAEKKNGSKCPLPKNIFHCVSWAKRRISPTYCAFYVHF